MKERREISVIFVKSPFVWFVLRKNECGISGLVPSVYLLKHCLSSEFLSFGLPVVVKINVS